MFALAQGPETGAGFDAFGAAAVEVRGAGGPGFPPPPLDGAVVGDGFGLVAEAGADGGEEDGAGVDCEVGEPPEHQTPLQPAQLPSCEHQESVNVLESEHQLCLKEPGHPHCAMKHDLLADDPRPRDLFGVQFVSFCPLIDVTTLRAEAQDEQANASKLACIRECTISGNTSRFKSLRN